MIQSSPRTGPSPKNRPSQPFSPLPGPSRSRILPALFACLLLPAPGAWAATPPPATQNPAEKTLKAPLSFEPNQGQSGTGVQFVSRGSGYTLVLAAGEAVVSLERQHTAATPEQRPSAAVDTLHMALIGADRKAAATGLDRLPGTVNYFLGNDPKKWHTAIPTYAKVNYSGIYPGIDLVFYGNQRQLEYDFVVAPGADPGQIAWKIDGASASVDAEGNLVLTAGHGPAGFEKPVVYQTDGGKKIHVDGAFEVAGNQVRFRLGGYDHAKPLVIDPVLAYASYLGGSGLDNIGNTSNQDGNPYQALAIDSEGSAYVVGYTWSTDLPVVNPDQGPTAKTDGSHLPWVFVSKFSPNGSSLLYSTYLGGDDWDLGYSIAVDSEGSAYVTGTTASPNFPVTTGAYQTICGGDWQGSPVVRIPSCPAVRSAFVTKLSPNGGSLAYSTFLSGFQGSIGNAIAVDSTGRAYVTGYTHEACASYQPSWCPFPTTAGALISGSATGGNSPDYVFLSVFDPTGAKLLYSTLFGDITPPMTANQGIGVANTDVTAITVDSANNFYLTGTTSASVFPITKGVFQTTQGPLTNNGQQLYATRGFVTKFKALSASNATSLAYSTYLGGHQAGLVDNPTGIAVDKAGNAYISGFTDSWDFPTTAGSFQPACGFGKGYECSTGFVAKLNPTASALVWSSYLGNTTALDSNPISAVGPVALDANDNVYVTGKSTALFYFVNPVEPGIEAGTTEAFVTEFAANGAKLLFSTYVGSSGNSYSSPAGLAVDAEGDIYVAGNNSGGLLITTPGAFQTEYGGIQDGFVAKIVPRGTAATTLSAAPSPASPGQPVAITATVAGAGIGSIPTGNVVFSVNSAPVATVALDSTGKATLTRSWAGAGSAVIEASYLGDSTYPANTAAPIQITITRFTPVTTLSASPSPATLGQAVTLTLNVAAATGEPTPTGAVSFYSGSVLVCSATLNSSGAATCSTTPTVAGPTYFSAIYTGNGVYLRVSTPSIKVNIDQPTKTTLTASPNPAWIGETVTLSAAVAPTSGAAIPPGTFTFYSGTASLGSAAVSSTGKATLATKALALGTDALTAVYVPAAGYDFVGSTSVAVSEKVNPGTATKTTISLPETSSYAGNPLAVAITVTPASGTASPTGTVKCLAGTTVFATVAVGAGGKASCTTATLTPGSYAISAAYTPTAGADFSSSVSTPESLAILTPIATATTFTISPSAPAAGQSVKFAATVKAATGTAVPTGPASLYINGALVQTITLGAGKATFTDSSLSAGTYSIYVYYWGAKPAGFAPSTAAVQKLTIP